MIFKVDIWDNDTAELRSTRQVSKASDAVEFIGNCINHYHEKEINVLIEFTIDGRLCMLIDEKYFQLQTQQQ